MLSSDDADVRAYVVATLGGLRYVVLEAARGEDALRHVDEYESIWSLMW
jgi:CheY-like chemotaxis protein